MVLSNDLLERAEILQNLLISHATGSRENNKEYEQLRKELLSKPTISEFVPHFLRTCRNLSQFWEHIKHKFPTYSERRVYLRGEFSPLLDELEGKTKRPSDQAISRVLEKFNADNVHLVWSKALERRTEDPEGAITLSRTLLESVCKHILDEKGVEYKDGLELPKLYSLTANELDLAPSQHSERIFKQILGGCFAVVEGLGALRNRLSDAHGKGKRPVKPAARHAELAVNLAGTMAMFLVETWEVRNEEVT